MNKYSHEPGYVLSQTKRLSASQLWVRIVGTRVKQQLTYVPTLLIMGVLLFTTMGDAWARPLFATAPPLGTAASFAVLAGSTATNTGPTVVTGDLGVHPGSAVVGFPPGTVVGGTIHAGDAAALQAQSDTTVAYNDLAGQACNTNLTGMDLGGLTLVPGVYCFNVSAQLTGILTLDGLGDPAAVFVFKIGSTLTTASASSVLLINGASSCNVFWQVGSSATLGTNTAFVGSILALESITLNTSANLLGRALARNGAVTMDSNNISTFCTIAPTYTPVPTATNTATLTPTNTATLTPTNTATLTPTNTATLTPTNTATLTPTNTATLTPTNTATLTPTNTATLTPTNTATLTPTNTATLTPTNTATLTPTNTATLTPTNTATLTPTNTATLTPTNTATMTATTTPGEVEIDKVFCPSDSTRTEFEVFLPQPSKPLVTARQIDSCESGEGIAFTIKDSSGKSVAHATTGPGGIVQFDLPSGTYTLIEDVSGASTTFIVEANMLTAIFVRNFILSTPTQTPSPTKTLAPPTNTATKTPVTPTKTPTNTATKTPTLPTKTATLTMTPAPTKTPAPPTNTATKTPVTPTKTPTNTATKTPILPTKTATLTMTPAPTKTPAPPTNTATKTPVTPTKTPTNTATKTPILPTKTATLTMTPAPTKTPAPPTNTATKTPVTPTKTPTNTATKTPILPTKTATLTMTPAPTKTPAPPTNTATKTPVTPTKTPTNTPTVTPTPAPGEVKLIKFFCASGDTGTIISINGAPQPKGQNNCQPGNAQFKIDGGLPFEVGSDGISLFALAAGSHTIIEVVTGKSAQFTVATGKITTIVVYNFPN